MADDFKHIGEADAARNGPPAGALDHRAIGQRIAEWTPQLEDIRAVVDGGQGNRQRRGKVGIAPAVRYATIPGLFLNSIGIR